MPNSEFCSKGKVRDEAVAGGGQDMLLGVKCWLLSTVHSCRGTEKTAGLVPLRRAYRLLPGMVHYTLQAGIILSRRYNARA